MKLNTTSSIRVVSETFYLNLLLLNILLYDFTIIKHSPLEMKFCIKFTQSPSDQQWYNEDQNLVCRT